MIPKRVTLKNFLSFGDEEQVFDFTEPDESLWILTGPNGVGKSAVFDAITYCLFLQHRGGKSDFDNLIRHGANILRVTFEFEFNGVDYRIIRTRGANTTQRVEEKKPGSEHWTAIPGVNGKDELKAWVENSLGLKFDAFTASVLLRQGEADAIVEATGGKRLDILKRIIDVERFEALSGRIAAATKEHADHFKDLRQQRETRVSATEAEVEAAKVALEVAEAARTAAQEAKLNASQRVEQAKQFVKLDSERTTLDGQLRDADERAKHSEQIKKSHERFAVLQGVVSPLRKIATAQTRIGEAEEKQQSNASALATLGEEQATTAAALEKARTDAAAHTQAQMEHDSEAKRLGKEVTDEARFLKPAEEVQKLTQQLAGFAPDLDAKLQTSQDSHQTAEKAVTAASGVKTETDTRLKQVTERQAEFETVGATCSLCRQPVNEKHAAEERAKLAGQLEDLTGKLKAAELALKTAEQKKLTAKTEADSLAADVLTRDQAAASYKLHKKTLDTFGIQSDPIALQQQLDAKQTEKSQHERQALTEAALANTANDDAKRLDTSFKKLGADRIVLDAESRTLETTLAADRAERNTLLATLRPDWQAQAATITEPELKALEAERTSLEGEGIADRFAALQSDSTSQIEWNARRKAVENELAGLPTGSVADAEANVIATATAAQAANQLRDGAKSEVERLNREAAAFKLLLAEIVAAETVFERHRKLNAWLGKDGLLRELVREAERDIVRYAQATLNNLSGGDLEITLQGESDGKDEALKLLVRRQGSDAPIPVKYLSGSQKFRVAVAIAIAIGKFASGTSAARPLESVIIDEGFGSLDKDGLTSMREELENLKNSNTLKRIILVSHQEEFTSSFPVGYRLEPGENGTIARRFQAG